MAVILKIVLALLQALPALLDVFSRRQMDEKHEKSKARVEADPIGEFEREFGRVSVDERGTGESSTSLSGTKADNSPNDASNAR